jgi:hypothetical protein
MREPKFRTHKRATTEQEARDSLLDEATRPRRVFALMSLIMLVISLGQFFVTSAA